MNISSMQKELLIVLEEELGELAIAALQMQKRVSKHIRFQHLMDEGRLEESVQSIQEELNDVVSLITLLQKKGLVLEVKEDHIKEKMERVLKYIPE